MGREKKVLKKLKMVCIQKNLTLEYTTQTSNYKLGHYYIHTLQVFFYLFRFSRLALISNFYSLA